MGFLFLNAIMQFLASTRRRSLHQNVEQIMRSKLPSSKGEMDFLFLVSMLKLWQLQQVCGIYLLNARLCDCDLSAVEGLGNDFTTDANIGLVNPSTPATVRVNFRADGVALEPDETFRLTLSDGFGLESGSKNVFLQDTAEFTIIDSDGL